MSEPTVEYSTDTMTETMDRHAAGLGLKGVKVLRAACSDGVREYVVFENGKPIYANSLAEAIACRLEIIAFADKH